MNIPNFKGLADDVYNGHQIKDLESRAGVGIEIDSSVLIDGRGLAERSSLHAGACAARRPHEALPEVAPRRRLTSAARTRPR